jgi:hypothetical protein
MLNGYKSRRPGTILPRKIKCKQCAIRVATRNDGLCPNCGYFADKAAEKTEGAKK